MSGAQFSTCQVSVDIASPQSRMTSESCVLVVADGAVTGICTERDLVQLAAQGRSPQGLTIADVMTSPVITKTVDELTDVFATLQFMQRRHIRNLPVLDQQGHLLGVATPNSLRQLLKLMDLLRLRQIEEVMQPHVVQATTTTSVLKIAQQMAHQRVSCVVIVDTMTDTTRPIGIVTERDIVQFQCLELDLATLQAESIMSTPLQCLQPQDTLWAAHRLMQEKRIRRLVITNTLGHLVGLVTQTSMLSIFGASEIDATLDMLQQRIQALEAERLELLETRNLALKQQVAERTVEMKERADRERFLAAFARQASQSFDFQTMLTAAVQEVKQFLDCDRVVVYQFGDNFQGTVIAEAVAPSCMATLGSQYRDVCFPEWLEASYLDGCQRLVDNIYQANLQACHIEFLESLQVKSYLVVPILINHHLWGLLVAHHCTQPRSWAGPNLELLDRLSTQLAIAIQQGQLYHQAQVEIQERQQAELNLQQERNFANAIVNAAGALVVVSNATGRIVQFNQTCQRVTGYTLEEVQGRRVWDFLIPPEERDQIRHLIEDVLTVNSQGISENCWLTKTGERRLIAWTNSTLLDTQGQVEYMIGTGIDVTEARQAEAALRKSEATNRALLDTIPDLMIRMQRDGTFLDFLPAPDLKMYQPFESMSGRNIFDVMPADVARERMHYVEQTFATGQTQLYEYEFEAEGQRFYEEARIAIVSDNEVLVIIRDISERKKLEAARAAAELERQQSIDALRQLNQELESRVTARTKELSDSNTALMDSNVALLNSQEQLRRSEELLRLTIDNAPIGIATANLNGHFLMVNQAFCTMLGYTSTEIMEQTFNSLTYPDDRATSRDVIHQLMTTDVDTFEFEKRYIHRDGTLVDTIVRVGTVRDLEGQPLYFVAEIEDIRDRKAAEAEVQKALQVERELNELKSRFVSITSHEFRTPLGVIASSAGIIQDYGDRLDAAKQNKHLTRIQDSVRHMTQLLEDVLTLSRVEAGKVQLRYAPTLIFDFCQEIVEELHFSSDSDRIAIQMEASPSLTSLVDQRMLRQILTNLLSNALKYSLPESPVYLEIKAYTKGYEIVIQDQGIGIPEEDLKHLFQSFHRAKNVGDIPGTGLGLSIVKKLVELHQGTIACQSQMNVGTTFTIHFPLRLAP